MINSVCNIHIKLLQNSLVHYSIIQASELSVQSATDIAKNVLEGIIIPMHCVYNDQLCMQYLYHIAAE